MLDVYRNRGELAADYGLSVQEVYDLAVSHVAEVPKYASLAKDDQWVFKIALKEYMGIER